MQREIPGSWLPWRCFRGDGPRRSREGKTLDEALQVKDRDVFRRLVQIPDQKQHCIRLAVKTLEKAIKEYAETQTNKAA